MFADEYLELLRRLLTDYEKERDYFVSNFEIIYKKALESLDIKEWIDFISDEIYIEVKEVIKEVKK